MFRFTQSMVMLGLFSSATAFAAPEPARLAHCAGLRDDARRLACYDALFGARNAALAASDAGAATTPDALPLPAAAPAGADVLVAVPPGTTPAASLLAQHWETGLADKQGLFAFRAHQDNYLLFAKYDPAPNNGPFTTLAGQTIAPVGLQHAELAFQLSFKMKLLEDVSPQHADLWFGYTQQSFWQAYNARGSRPFRDTNYQPELIAVVPAKFDLLGVQSQFVNFGLVHQSNGQASTLSRSWNRVYAQLGVERGDVTVVARVWKRLDTGSDRDNPDIVDYLGRGDVVVNYRPGKQRLTLLARHNFQTGRGATQLGWVTPIKDDLKGYLQLFSGYGQSLIDYNAYQRTVGIGVMIDY